MGFLSNDHKPYQLGLAVDAAQKNLSSDRFSFFSFMFCLLLILAQILLILSSWGKLPAQIPLFYSKPWGEGILAPVIFIWFLPLISVLLVVFDFSINIFFVKGRVFLSRILITICVLCSIAVFYGCVKIISLLT